MTALDDALTSVWENVSELLASDARSELAALRATITEACALIDMLNTTIATQAQQLEEAQEIFENIFRHDWSNRKLLTAAEDWLSAKRRI